MKKMKKLNKKPNEIIEQRKEMKKKLTVLRKAKNIINQNFE